MEDHLEEEKKIKWTFHSDPEVIGGAMNKLVSEVKSQKKKFIQMQFIIGDNIQLISGERFQS